MIAKDIQAAIIVMAGNGRKKKEIARELGVSINTVRKVLHDGMRHSNSQRKDKKEIDLDLLAETYNDCAGYIQRTYEKLTEEQGLNIGYSTLSRLLRENNISNKPDKQSEQFPDVPGEEMQHDTSSYKVMIGDKKMAVICSALYFRYCKMRYIWFYKSFERFKMKCFFHKAFMHFGYTAKTCIIDNTSLVVIAGSGRNAILSSEMVVFSKKYGFDWIAHEKNHPNRKAGKERNFRTIETNFFPGRKFKSLEDLNEQGFRWATERYAKRPLSKTRLIPAELFETEKPYLKAVPSYVFAPCRDHERTVDQYGYVSFGSNYYWLPKAKSTKVKVIEYAEKIDIYHNKVLIQTYNLPPFGHKNKKFFPDGNEKPLFQPRKMVSSAQEEEKILRNISQELAAYLDFIKSTECKCKQKQKLIREIYYISKKTTKTIFLKVVQRALKYKVYDIGSINQMIGQVIQSQIYIRPDVTPDQNYMNREAFQQGRFSDENEIIIPDEPAQENTREGEKNDEGNNN